MSNYILIAGTFHGGWYWDPIVPILEKAGHKVFTPTLTGLEPGEKIIPINLDTHINDVIKLIDANSLDEVILVGWSYAGMVITGVADRTKVKIKKLIYLDAQLPKSGQCEFDLMPKKDCEEQIAMCLDGISIYPVEMLTNFEPRVQPHPIGTKLQPLKYDQAKFDQIAKVFIFAEQWFHDPLVISPIKPSYEYASQMPGWQLHSWPYGHDLVKEAPDQLSKFLLDQN